MQVFSSGRRKRLLKLEKRGENGVSQKERGRGRGEREEKIFSPLPLPSFLFSPSQKITVSKVNFTRFEVTCCAGVFFGQAKAPVETRKEGRKWGESKGAG